MIRVDERISWQDVQADLVIFNAANGRYYGLDAVASDIWRAIARLGNLDDVIVALRERYDDADPIADDVRTFVKQAVDVGLLVDTADNSHE